MYEETARGDVVLSFGDQVFLFLVDEIDVAAGPRLLALVRGALASGASAVVLDLSGVSFLDCAGLGLVLGARDRLLAAGRSVTAPAPSAAVSRVLALTATQLAAAGPSAAHGPGRALAATPVLAAVGHPAPRRVGRV